MINNKKRGGAGVREAEKEQLGTITRPVQLGKIGDTMNTTIRRGEEVRARGSTAGNRPNIVAAHLSGPATVSYAHTSDMFAGILLLRGGTTGYQISAAAAARHDSSCQYKTSTFPAAVRLQHHYHYSCLHPLNIPFALRTANNIPH